jgi:hypothetical protein
MRGFDPNTSLCRKAWDIGTSIRQTFLVVMGLGGLIIGNAGCSADVSVEKTVSKDDVAKQISSKVNDQSGQAPESVSCPGDLKASVGATLNCTMTANGQNDNVNVTVTKVNGDDVDFDMVETIPKDDVAKQISDQLTQQVGHKPDSVTCPDNLKATVGATLRCQLTDGTTKLGVTATVTGVQGGNVKYDIKVDDQPQSQ